MLRENEKIDRGFKQTHSKEPIVDHKKYDEPTDVHLVLNASKEVDVESVLSYMLEQKIVFD